jgi:hypothetical protein
LELRGRGGTTRRAEEVEVVVVVVVRGRRGQLPLAVVVFLNNVVSPLFIIALLESDDWANDSARPMLAATRRRI